MNFFKIHKNKKLISNIVRITTEVMVVFIFLIVIGLINKNFLFFSDTIHYSFSYPDNYNVVEPLTPLVDKTFLSNGDDEVIQISNQLITSNLTEFSIQVPEGFSKDFSKANISMNFDPGSINEILVGPQITSSGEFSYFPIYNKELEELNWNKINSDGYTLWQRDNTYSSLDEFFINFSGVLKTDVDNIIKQLQVSEYYFDQMGLIDDEIDGDITINTIPTIPFVEGSFNAYTYIPQSDLLTITVTKYDNNYLAGADPVDIYIYNSKGELMSKKIMPDDGSIISRGKIGPKQITTIALDDANAGMYKIQVIANDSLVSLSVNQPYLVVENSLVLTDNVISAGKDPYTIYTEATEINLPSWHVGSSNQTITIDNNRQVVLDDSRLTVNNIKIDLSSDENKLHQIQLEQNHLSIKNSNTESNQYFSFSAESYFNPVPLRLKTLDIKNGNLEDSSINYLITEYNSPQKRDYHYFGEVEFDLSVGGNIINDKIVFSIYIPENTKALKEGVKIISLDVILKK